MHISVKSIRRRQLSHSEDYGTEAHLMVVSLEGVAFRTKE